MIIKYSENITIAKIPKSNSTLRIMTENTLTTMPSFYSRFGKPDKDIYILNGGVFDYGTKKAVYTFKTDGVWKIIDSLYRGMGVLWTGEVIIGTKNDYDFRDFVSGLPPLLKDGKNWNDGSADRNHGGYAHRSIAGFDDAYYYLIAVDIPYTFQMEIDLCIKLGLKSAINLDGGGSTRLSLNGFDVNRPTENRAVHNFIVIETERNHDMEYKEPNWAYVNAAFVQVDKNGNIQVQNSVFEWAKMNAEAKGWAVWEKATHSMIYPEKKTEPVTPCDDAELKKTKAEYKASLNEIKSKLTDVITLITGELSK